MKDAGLDTMAVDEPSEEEIEQEACEMKITAGIRKAAVNLRNSLAHGEPYLAPSCYHRLRMTGDLIIRSLRDQQVHCN